MSYNLIRVFEYDVSEAEIVKYKGDNDLSFAYTFTVFSLDRKTLLTIQFQETNNSTKFFENWIIKEDEKQITYTGLSFGEAGTGITPPSVIDYSVDSFVGNEWKNVNLVSIQYNNDFSRIVKLFSFTSKIPQDNPTELKVLDQYKYNFSGGTVYQYLSENEYYSTYTFQVKSLKNEVTFSVFYSEVNDKKDFFTNWIMYDNKNSNQQITFAGINLAGQNGSAGKTITNFGVKSVLGNKWKNAKIINIDLRNIVRVITILG